MAETKKPAIAPPINTSDAGKIKIIVSGKVSVKSGNPNVSIVRKD